MWKLSRTIASGVFAGMATLSAPSAPANAADIYDKYGSRAPSAYDDPRYADIYTLPPPPPRHVEAPPPYVEPRYERPYAYNDYESVPRDRYGHLRPIAPQRYRTAQPICQSHDEIRRSLRDDGWRDFQDVEIRDQTAIIQARRPSGQPYNLKIDRCSGDIVNARPLGERPLPYAYRDRYEGRTF
jgi:hypothetical protein